MDQATFWATKSRGPIYEAVTFEHPAFEGPIRLVANVFEPVTLGGQVHTPAPMSIKPPDTRVDENPKMVMTFPRAQVGREFKRQLRLIVASGLRTPISVTYDEYLGDTAAPARTCSLFVAENGGIAFGADSVQVQATVDNPMRRDVSLIYDPAVFSGLELI